MMHYLDGIFACGKRVGILLATATMKNAATIDRPKSLIKNGIIPIHAVA